MVSSPITSWQIDGETMETVTDFILGGSKLTSKVMLKILQARLQYYMNHELPDVQAGCSESRGTRDQIANICWNIEKARKFQKTIYFCFVDYAKVCVWITTNCGKFLKRWEYRSLYLSPEKPVYGSRSNNYNWTWKNGLVQNWERTRLYIVTSVI